MSPIERSHKSRRMSQVVTHGGLIYLAGQVADEAEGRSVAELMELHRRLLEVIAAATR